MWRVLLLHYTPRPHAVRLTTQQHLRALTRLPEPAQVLSYNAVHGAPSWLRHLDFDAIVLHTTLLCQRWNPWFTEWKRHVEWIGDVDCLKIAFPQAERGTDIVYRARHLPYWYGSHGQLKHGVGDIVAERAPAHGLSCDISTRANETILGDAWLEFLGSARATVGVESGCS